MILNAYFNFQNNVMKESLVFIYDKIISPSNLFIYAIGSFERE